MQKNELEKFDNLGIKNKIYSIRGQQVMLDRDLAELYEVETRILNQAVKRNMKRFPIKFMFQLSKAEFEDLRLQIETSNKSVKQEDTLMSQIVISKENRGGIRKLPYIFTEQGVAMLSAVLRSDIAIEMSIQIMDAFIKMRKELSSKAMIFQKIDNVENKQLLVNTRFELKFEKIFKAIEAKDLKPKQGIFFEGQIFDAYLLVSNLIKRATNSIILIDNYIDESVLILFSERNKDCKVVIYTKKISKKLELSLKKYNEQHPVIEIKEFKKSHDRFLILDEEEIYHIGASLKDLGKKWFAFSKLDKVNLKLLERLKNSD